MVLLETLAEHSSLDALRDFCSQGEDYPPKHVPLAFSSEHILVSFSALLHIVHSAPTEPAVWGLTLCSFRFSRRFSYTPLVGYEYL